ncbi:uncharacterized threonine-rich GPI-anchored glycoprotein PJ4664.02-like, partial [Stegodyphus dumicola]|uniref:uncharacterized threonine-rich GPI-anchored glycoprotein PJ4664.02-like n=1 Tax=Stegodyphus dumicola TaxID=202533 RepID=UPI0015AF931F
MNFAVILASSNETFCGFDFNLPATFWREQPTILRQQQSSGDGETMISSYTIEAVFSLAKVTINTEGGRYSASALSLAIDESCDIKNMAQVALFVRYISSQDPKEELMGLLPLYRQNRGEDVANAVQKSLEDNKIDLNKIFTIATDESHGVAVVVGILRNKLRNKSIFRDHCCYVRLKMLIWSLAVLWKRDGFISVITLQLTGGGDIILLTFSSGGIPSSMTNIKGSVDKLTFTQVSDMLPEAVAPNSQTEEDQKEGEDDIRNNTEQYGKLEPMLTNGNHIFEGLGGHEKEESVSENNNEPTTPNQNFMTESPKYEPSPAVSDVIPPNKSSESENKLNICDTVEEEKKVPPDLPPPRPESPKQDAAQVRSKPSSPFPLKSPHFLPLQNGPLQQPEPSAAVAAVTVTTSTANPATVPTSSQLGSSNPAPLPSSTSPAGGVPFPSSLLSQEEFPVSPTAASSASKTISPVLRSKSYDSVVKPRKGSNSDVVHSVPYPICSSYSDYTVNYSTNQYPTNKHSYLNQDNRDTNQRVHHQKFVANNYYHHHQQPSLEKYPKETVPRATSKEIISCDGYKNDNYIENRFESKPGNDDLNYCISQAYTNEKPCDPQSVYKKTNPNNVYNFKSNELLTQNSNESNVVRNSGDKSTNKLVADCYPNVTKAKVPNRTTYYQSIVNKTHSRHKTSRRVLPASAYENNSKPVVNNYPIAKHAELIHGHGNKPVQYASSHYNTEGKKTDYYQPVSLATTSTSNNYNCSPYKLDAHQSNISNNSTCSSNWTESQSVGSRNFKVNTEQCVNSYREKSAVNNAVNTNSKAYNVHQGVRSFHDGHSKIPAESSSDYGNNDYYQKGSVTYSRSGTTQSAISDNFKSANHTTELAAYQNRNQAYSHSRTSNEKNRSLYQNQENNFKQYQQELVPKQNIETSHNYKIQGDVNAYSHYGSSSSLKSKETVTQNLESSKPVPIEHISNNSLEVNSNIQPSVSEGTTYYPSSSARDKATFYPYAEPSHFQHRRTPPIPVQASKPQTTFEPLNIPPKDTEGFRISSSSTAISSYSQRTTVSSPVTVFDNSRSTVKTIWSPSITTASISGTTNREVIAASSRDSHSSHSNSSISSLSQLSQSLGSGPQGTSVQSSKEFPREGRSSSNGHSRSSSRNETPVCSTVPVTSSTSATVSSTSASYGVSGSLTSLIFSKPSWTSPSVTTVLTNPGSHFTPPVSGSLGSPVPSVLPLAPSLPSNHHSSPFSHHPSAAALHSAGHHVMFAPPLPPAGSLSSPSLPLATAAGPSPFGGDSLFAPPSSQDLLRRDLDARFLASQDRSINVPPPPYLRAEMHQHQHQHTHMHQHSPFLPPPIGSSLLPPSAAHLYDKFPKVDSSFYGRNALGLPAYPLSPLLAPGSATATPTPFAPPGHLAAFQPKISSLVKAKTMKSGRWCAMHVRISWEIYHHQQKQQADSQKSGNGTSKAVSDLLRPPNHLFGSIPRPHELGFSSPLLGAA